MEEIVIKGVKDFRDGALKGSRDLLASARARATGPSLKLFEDVTHWKRISLVLSVGCALVSLCVLSLAISLLAMDGRGSTPVGPDPSADGTSRGWSLNSTALRIVSSFLAVSLCGAVLMFSNKEAHIPCAGLSVVTAVIALVMLGSAAADTRTIVEAVRSACRDAGLRSLSACERSGLGIAVVTMMWLAALVALGVAFAAYKFASSVALALNAPSGFRAMMSQVRAQIMSGITSMTAAMLPPRCRYCGSRVSSSGLADHEASCPGAISTCDYCRGEVPTDDLQKHRLECLYRPVPCEHCSAIIVSSEIDRHIGRCERVVVPCPHGCGEEMERGDVPAHVSNDCVRRALVCPFCGEASEDAAALESHRVVCRGRKTCLSCETDVARAALEDHEMLCRLTGHLAARGHGGGHRNNHHHHHHHHRGRDSDGDGDSGDSDEFDRHGGGGARDKGKSHQRSAKDTDPLLSGGGSRTSPDGGRLTQQQHASQIAIPCMFGCGETHRSAGLSAAHASMCEMRPVGCQRCGVLVAHSFMRKHEAACPAAEAQCPHCGLRGARIETLEHAATCEARTVTCGSCGRDDVPISLIADHTKECMEPPPPVARAPIPAVPPLSVACEFCGEVTAPGHEAQAHAAACRLRGHCSLCGEHVAVSQMPRHLDGACTASVLTCQYCAATVRIGDIDAHMKEFHKSKPGNPKLTPRFWEAGGGTAV